MKLKSIYNVFGPPRITYVARSFLDYRIPVIEHLDGLCNGNFIFISSTKWTPDRALNRLKKKIGGRAIFLSGEKSLGVDMPIEANKSICIPYQHGLIKTIIETNPDVLLGDGFFQWSYAALSLRIFKFIPLVICYERWAHTERNAQWYRSLYRKLALRYTDAVCCNGVLSKEYTESIGISKDRITCGNMAADHDVLTERSSNFNDKDRTKLRKNYRLNGMVFLVVSRLIHQKGIEQLLYSWNSYEHYYNYLSMLLIVGSGPEEKRLKEIASHLGLGRVRFAGHIDYDQIPLFYASSDALIMPTLEDNWSLVVPEAMACGLPIICSKYNGCWPELVKEGDNGWVFDPLSRNDTLRVLNEASKETTNLKFMGSRSKAIVSKYSPRNAAKSIFDACIIAMDHRCR